MVPVGAERTVSAMSSLLKRLSLAFRVFREDPDEVVTLRESGWNWTARYRDAEISCESESDALAEIAFRMKLMRDEKFQKRWVAEHGGGSDE